MKLLQVRAGAVTARVSIFLEQEVRKKEEAGAEERGVGTAAVSAVTDAVPAQRQQSASVAVAVTSISFYVHVLLYDYLFYYCILSRTF